MCCGRQSFETGRGHATPFFGLDGNFGDRGARLIDQAIKIKRDEKEGRRPPLLAGRTLGLLFEKPSLRTRVSFEAAIARLGGNAIFLHGKDVGLGVRESLVDFARILSQYIDGLAARTFSHATVDELARSATIPVINALSDTSHPCQAMADLMTIEEPRGSITGTKLVFVGDGNNVARSLAAAAALLADSSCWQRRRAMSFRPTTRQHFATGSPIFPWSSNLIPEPRSTAPLCLHRRLGQHGPGE